MAKPGKSDKTAAKEIRHRTRRAEIIGSVIGQLIKVGGIVLCMRYVMLSVESLSGQRTIADIGLTGKLQISAAVAWLFGGGGMAYGWQQRKLRHNVIEETATRVSKLEAELDKNRSSSRLTRRGETNPEDEP